MPLNCLVNYNKVFYFTLKFQLYCHEILSRAWDNIVLQFFSKSSLRLGLLLMVLIAGGHFNKSSWIKCHCNHSLMIKITNSNMLLLGDSTIAGLAQYQIVWKIHFVLLNAIVLRMCSAKPSVYHCHCP